MKLVSISSREHRAFLRRCVVVCALVASLACSDGSDSTARSVGAVGAVAEAGFSPEGLQAVTMKTSGDERGWSLGSRRLRKGVGRLSLCESCGPRLTRMAGNVDWWLIRWTSDLR